MHIEYTLALREVAAAHEKPGLNSEIAGPSGGSERRTRLFR
jgi:hypothetical protein